MALNRKIAQMTSNETQFGTKHALILCQSDYSELRKIDGCNDLGDLKATENDAVTANYLAIKLGIKHEDI